MKHLKQNIPPIFSKNFTRQLLSKIKKKKPKKKQKKKQQDCIFNEYFSKHNNCDSLSFYNDLGFQFSGYIHLVNGKVTFQGKQKDDTCHSILYIIFDESNSKIVKIGESTVLGLLRLKSTLNTERIINKWKNSMLPRRLSAWSMPCGCAPIQIGEFKEMAPISGKLLEKQFLCNYKRINGNFPFFNTQSS